jgi:hypothetical protein
MFCEPFCQNYSPQTLKFLCNSYTDVGGFFLWSKKHTMMKQFLEWGVFSESKLKLILESRNIFCHLPTTARKSIRKKCFDFALVPLMSIFLHMKFSHRIFVRMRIFFQKSKVDIRRDQDKKFQQLLGCWRRMSKNISSFRYQKNLGREKYPILKTFDQLDKFCLQFPEI